MLRASTGGPLEPVTVLQLSETGCLIESSRSLELGERVVLEVVSDGELGSASGTIVSSNELQLLYSIRFEGEPALSPRLIASAGESDDRPGD